MLLVNKPIGWTPKQCVEWARLNQNIRADIPVGYAGRLDPMARGLVMLMVGDECRDEKTFQNQEKIYEWSAVLGITTDSFDVLGIPTRGNNTVPSFASFAQLLQEYLGKKTQQFPPYSSKPVQGKPLYQWARAGLLDHITIPSHEVEFLAHTILDAVAISSTDLLTSIEEKITHVTGDFRQQEIIARWREVLQGVEQFTVVTVRSEVGSGTYVRQLIHDLGKRLGTGAIAFDIYRTHIGTHFVLDADVLCP